MIQEIAYVLNDAAIRVAGFMRHVMNKEIPFHPLGIDEDTGTDSQHGAPNECGILGSCILGLAALTLDYAVKVRRYSELHHNLRMGSGMTAQALERSS